MRPLLVGVGAAALLAVLAELLAVPVATRLVGDALGRCLPHNGVSIEAVDRPVVPRLLLGRARNVELAASAFDLGGLRVEVARLTMPDVILPWAVGALEPDDHATVELLVLEEDAARFLAGATPLGLRPSVEVTPDAVRLGLPPVPATVEVVVVLDDGAVLITPAGGRPQWWSRLGIAERIEPPPDVDIDRLELGIGAVTATLRVPVVAGVDGSTGCARPLG